ncbi:hypothetical protein LINGRAHAP2_LOCUS10585 [Linum grandiflorum]
MRRRFFQTQSLAITSPLMRKLLEESEGGDDSERIDGRFTDDSEDDALDTMRHDHVDPLLLAPQGANASTMATPTTHQSAILAEPSSSNQQPTSMGFAQFSTPPMGGPRFQEKTRDGSIGFHEVAPITNTTKEGNQTNSFGMDTDALYEDLQFLQQLEGQYHLMEPPSALLSSSSVKEALVTVGNFLSQAMGSVATESIQAWMEAIERSKKLQDTMNHEKSMRTSTSTNIQDKVAKSKAMSLHVSTSQKEKAARTSKIAELETELQRLRAEEAKENSKTEALTHNLKTMVAEVCVLVEKEKALPPMKEIAFQHAKAVLEEREHKAKLAKLKDVLKEIQKTLNP